MSMSFTVNGADRRIRFVWEEAAAAWAVKVSPLAVQALRAAAPVSKGLDPNGPKPGRLRDSISGRTEQAGSVTSIVLYSQMPYAGFVIGGTKPHPITPKNARMLHWVGSDGDHFSPYVNHPGTKANPFAQRAVESITPLLMTLFAEAAREATHL